MKKLLLSASMLCTMIIYALNETPDHEKQINQFMTNEQQQKTGVQKLSKEERKELETWLQNYSLQSKSPNDSEAEKNFESFISQLSINAKGGAFLILNNNSVWEVDPEDYILSSGWISPVKIRVMLDLGNPYPFKLLNMQSNQSVNAKKATWSSIPKDAEPLPPIPKQDIEIDNPPKPTKVEPLTPLEERQNAKKVSPNKQ